MTKTIALLLSVGLAAASAALWMSAAAQPVTVDEIGDENQTVEHGRLPLFASKGDVARLYAFAAAETLRWMPCTCGCRSFGHVSNRSCYVKSESDGRVTFTSHAAT